MKARLREQLKMADSPVSAYSNPLAAVCVASSHGFTPEADIVVQVAMKQYDFGKPEDLKTYKLLRPSTITDTVHSIFMPDENNLNADSVPLVNEGFTQGGDMTLRSTDGFDFSVHSVLLSLASPVFSDLLLTGNKREAICFSEKAKVLALMLKFIYPRPAPIISSVDLFDNALRVANKYQLESMKQRLQEQLTRVESPLSVLSNPMSVLYLASLHGLTAEAELAANLASKHYNFSQGEGLKKLLDAALTPSTAALVKLTGIPLVKTRVLTEVLFHFEHAPMTIYNDGAPFLDALACVHCRETFRNFRRQSPPEWQFRWAHWIYDEIKDRPISEWKGYFSHTNVCRSFYQPHLQPTFCAYRYCNIAPDCVCISVITDSATQFQKWANGIFEHLISRLSVIAELESRSITQF
ncbi:BTB/POZ domain protein [Rhizoctonia solani AG-3 Rhs1AP]|nr:BTB/POZ domain protein [Rhizoctonia solani AG-3 Rhs1AP]